MFIEISKGKIPISSKHGHGLSKLVVSCV